MNLQPHRISNIEQPTWNGCDAETPECSAVKAGSRDNGVEDSTLVREIHRRVRLEICGLPQLSASLHNHSHP